MTSLMTQSNWRSTLSSCSFLATSGDWDFISEHFFSVSFPHYLFCLGFTTCVGKWSQSHFVRGPDSPSQTAILVPVSLVKH